MITDYTFRSAQGPPLYNYFDPLGMIRNLWSRRELTLMFARRDLESKYRASYFGMLWTVFSPLILLLFYTFIFSVVFGMKWGRDSSGGHGEFAINMFIGMLVFNVFSEVLNRSATLVISHPNFVNKVLFPLEILVPSILLSSLVSMGIGFLVWLAGRVILIGWPAWTALLLPIMILPICLLILGLGWFLASLGVFVRDISQIVSVVTQVLFLCTPIFYSMEFVEKAPRFIRALILLNPLTQVVVNAREVLMRSDGWPNWFLWAVSLLASTVAALLGYAFFTKSRRAFGDVI